MAGIRELHELKTEKRQSSMAVMATARTEIEEIIEKVKDQETIVNQFISRDQGLKNKLVEFDRKVIRKALPDTPDNQRLLRPAMLEELLKRKPVNQSEFLEFVPPYLRQATNSSEGKFLEAVLEIINSGVEEEFALS